MNVFFRFDSSADIGIGHLMRCMALADELKAQDMDVSIISRPLTGSMTDLADKRGFKTYQLSAETTDAGSDARQTIEILRERATVADWLIVDHYSLDANWETTVRPFVKKLMVIDDMADREHDCDLILNQDDFLGDCAMACQNWAPANCRKLLGPKYAILRPEFIEERRRLRVRDGQIRRILISFGGGDISNETCKVLRSLQRSQYKDVPADAVIGRSYPYRDELQQLASRASNIFIHVQTKEMANLMAAADLAFGAGGMTMFERCCLGLPSIVTIVAENQRRIVDFFSKTRAILSVDAGPTSADYLRVLSTLTPSLLFQLGSKAAGLIDTDGLPRIVKAMNDVFEDSTCHA